MYCTNTRNKYSLDKNEALPNERSPSIVKVAHSNLQRDRASSPFYSQLLNLCIEVVWVHFDPKTCEHGSDSKSLDESLYII